MAEGSSTSPNSETVTMRLPSGEEVDAIIPAGLSDDQAKSLMRMKRPDLFGAPAGMPKPPNALGVRGYDIMGPIPDTAMTRIGARIKQNLDPSQQVPAIASAISEGIRKSKLGGPADLPAVKQMFIDAAKQYEDPEKLVADVLSGYIASGAPEIPTPTKPPSWWRAPESAAPAATPTASGATPALLKIGKMIPGVSKYAHAADFLRDLLQPAEAPKAPTAPTSTYTGPTGPPEMWGRQATDSVVDQHIPNGADNLRVKSKIDFHLQRGDLAGAEAALDEAAGRTNPDYQPPSGRTEQPATGESEMEFERRRTENRPPTQIKGVGNKLPTLEEERKFAESFEKRGAAKKALESGEALPEGQALPTEDTRATAARLIQQSKANLPSAYEQTTPVTVPSVQNIRENIAMQKAAEAAPRRMTPDALEDHAIQQKMQQDLEEHGSRAESEARREFIARNSTGVTKGQLTGQTPVEQGDLTEAWQKALEEIRRRKGTKPAQ